MRRVVGVPPGPGRRPSGAAAAVQRLAAEADKSGYRFVPAALGKQPIRRRASVIRERRRLKHWADPPEPDLARVPDAWPTLPRQIKVAVLALAPAARQTARSRRFGRPGCPGRVVGPVRFRGWPLDCAGSRLPRSEARCVPGIRTHRLARGGWLPASRVNPPAEAALSGIDHAVGETAILLQTIVTPFIWAAARLPGLWKWQTADARCMLCARCNTTSPLVGRPTKSGDAHAYRF